MFIVIIFALVADLKCKIVKVNENGIEINDFSK